MATKHVIRITFDTNDTFAINDFVTTLKSIAPYMFDNVTVEKVYN